MGSIKLTFLLSILIGVIYKECEWLIFVIKSHQAYLNIYKVSEDKTKSTPHIGLLRQATNINSRDLKGAVQ